MSAATLAVRSTPEDQLSDIFAALANTTRRAILARLARGEATVKELAKPFDISLPAISKHIKVLEEVGLITQTRKAQYRPCALAPAPLQAVASWTDQYRHIWESSFDRMDAYIDELNAEGTEGGVPADTADSGFENQTQNNQTTNNQTTNNQTTNNQPDKTMEQDNE